MNWTPAEITPIATAIIGSTSAVCIALLTRKKNKSKDHEPVVTPPRPLAPQLATVTVAPVAAKETEKPKSITPAAQQLPIVNVSPALMIESLDRALPAHRESIQAHYIGLRIKWVMQLHSVYRFKEPIVGFTGTAYPERLHLDCEGKRENLLCLINIPDKGEILVEGTLKTVSSGYCELVDCVVALPS